MRYCINICLMFLLSVNTQGQSPSLYGRISSKEGQPVPGATLLLKEINKYTVSDSIGNYQFNALQPSKFTLIVSYLGYLLETRTIQIKRDTSLQLNLSVSDSYGSLKEISITSQIGVNQRITSIGKSPIAGRDLPQLSQIVDRSVLERQQALRVSDVLQNVAGVYIMGNTGGYQEEIASRGYAFNSNNTFKNGARFNNSISPELSSAEKIEFLKGGSAILYGNVSPGGIMNIITKKPKFEQGGEVSFRTGSYDLYKPSFDIYGPVANSASLAYRFNASYEKAGSFRDFVHSERIYFNPSLLYRLSSKTELLVEADHLSDNRTPDFGIGAIKYTIPDVDRGNFIGVYWGSNKVLQSSVTANLTHHLTGDWQIKAMYTYQSFKQDLFSAARANANGQMVATNGTWIRGLQKSGTNQKYNIAEIDISGTVYTGGIKHQVLVGGDIEKYQTTATAYNTNLYNNNLSNSSIRNKNIYDTINIYNPIQRRNDIPDLTAARITTSPIARFGIYAQDLISLRNNLKLLAGLRYSSQYNQTATVDTIGKGKGSIASYTSNAFSPKIGLVFQPLESVSVFASYTNNFTPNTGTDSNNLALKPSTIHQYEMGMKNDLWHGLVSVNFTVYKIVNSDFAQAVIPAPASNPSARELAGEVTSRGFEVDIQSKSIRGFTLIAGYSYNDSRYTKSNIYKTNDRLRYNPLNTVNANLHYQFSQTSALRRFNIGAGFYFVDDRVGGRNTTATNPDYSLMTIPDYSLFDLNLGYRFNRTDLRIKLSNIMNTLSHNVHDDNSVNPIAPRQFIFTVAQKF